VVAQIEAVLEDLHPNAVKTGMLATEATVRAVAELAAAGRLPNLVVDPVLVSSSGHLLMEAQGVAAYLHLLLPFATVATPNLREAAVLTDCAVEDLSTTDAMIEAARKIQALGATTVVVKGGHLGRSGSTRSPDVVAGPGEPVVLAADRVPTTNDHGTGCSLSAAIAARLALGDEVPEAVTAAKAFVHRGLLGAADWQLGAGHGPIDHFGWTLAGDRDRDPNSP
jgi:hydroxymethylpyrimidine/phosphomethylpyrimidine kinase